MPVAEQIAKLVNDMPDADRSGKPEGPPRVEVEPSYEAILAGGRDAVIALIGLLTPNSDTDDYKARMTLHNLAIHVGQKGKGRERAILVEAMASQLGGETGGRHKDVKQYVIQQLEWCGDAAAVGAVAKFLLDDDVYHDAARTLIAIARHDGQALPRVTEALRDALPTAKRKPHLAVLHALSDLKDKAALPAMRHAATLADAEIRTTAAWGLAHLADANSIEHVTKVADSDDPATRTGGTDALLRLAENLAAAGNKPAARRIYEHLHATRTDASERYIREAAAAGLGELN